MADDTLPYIFKKELKQAPGGGVLEEKSLTVQCKNIKEAKKIFDEEWRKE